MEHDQLKKLVKAARHGSPDAFGALYAEYSADLYRFALWYLHNEPDAEDAVQDACLHAYKNLKALRKEEAFRSWFFKILANICRDKLAAASKAGNIVSIDDPDSFTEPADETGEDFTRLSETGELIASLAEPDKSIVLLSVLAGFNSKEIGALLKLNSSTVRSRLSRALAKLRDRITTEEECKE